MSEDENGEDVEVLNERYLDTLGEQADLRERGFETLRDADAFPPLDVEAIGDVLATEGAEFDGDLVVVAASDFGHPAAFVPEGPEPAVALNRLLAELHREAGKWSEDESLQGVRTAVRDAEPNVHKVLPALLAEDVRYDLPSGTDSRANFVTIRQVVGLVDWVANSYQAGRLTVRY